MSVLDAWSREATEADLDALTFSTVAFGSPNPGIFERNMTTIRLLKSSTHDFSLGVLGFDQAIVVGEAS